MRSTIVTVTFRQDFRLPGHDTEFPAGRYAVLQEDERLEGPSFEAFRRIATFLRVEGRGAALGRTELHPILQQDLDAALAADGVGERPAPPEDGNPEKE